MSLCHIFVIFLQKGQKGVQTQLFRCTGIDPKQNLPIGLKMYKSTSQFWVDLSIWQYDKDCKYHFVDQLTFYLYFDSRVNLFHNFDFLYSFYRLAFDSVTL